MKKQRSIVQGLLAICLSLVMVLSLTACNSKKKPAGNETSVSQQEGPRFDSKWQLGQRKALPGAKPQGDIKWVKLNPSTGQFEPAQGSGDPSSWAPQLRPATKKFRIGFTNVAENFDFAVQAGNGIVKAAQEAGVELIRLDNNFPDNQKPLENADILVTKKVDLVLSFNVLAPLNQAIMKKYTDAKIPVVSIDVAAPGALFYGADNYGAGTLAGKAAVDLIKSRNWDPKETAVVLVEALQLGEVPMQRPMGFRDAILNDLKDLPLKNVFELPGDGATEKALESMSAWLTAHPEFKHIVATGVDDLEASGVATALQNAGRADGSAVYGMGSDASAVAALHKPAQGNAFQASIGYFPEKYGDYLIPMALDILEGKPVPEEVHMKHIVIDRNNINQYYPK